MFDIGVQSSAWFHSVILSAVLLFSFPRGLRIPRFVSLFVSSAGRNAQKKTPALLPGFFYQYNH
jgi:hypothetical protein